MRSITGYFKDLISEAREELATNGGAPIGLDARTVGVMIVTCVLLTLFYYYGRPGYFTSTFDAPVTAALGLEESEYRGLLRYGYWAIASMVLRIAIPVMIIVWWFRESPREYGFRLWEKGHGLIYVLMFAVMLPVIIAVSFSPDFQDKYPFYNMAGESAWHFIGYQLAYGIQFASLEAFFRGFLIFALFKKFGYYAIVIMTIPYCMIHFAKPMPETMGAIIAGLVLGYLAIQSKSWIPGALLHWG
ncbi:MAG: CPBP family intramembrane glutamic endopeptidase, partial [Bradymonadaceae bacterium]